MADTVYNPNLGDVETTFTQLSETKLNKGFNEVDYTDINNIADQAQIAPRQIRTGETRGDMQIRGLIKAQDASGRIVVMMGYSPGAF